jgi:DNA-directed RNA polymerase specialized sigma24 family protein
MRRARLTAVCGATSRTIDLTDGDDRLLHAALIETLASASPRRREVLALAAMGGLAPAAIASVLGLPVDKVAVQLFEGVNEVVSRFHAA